MIAESGPGTPSTRTGPIYAWFVVLVLLLVGIASYLDRNIIALLIEPIKADLALSDTQASLLQGTAFALFFVAFGYPSGMLVDRISRRNMLVFGVSLWSVMTAAGGLANSYWELFIARAAVGMGEALLAPAAFSLIADYFLPARRGRAMSTYNMANYLGGGTSMLVGGLVLQALSKTGRSQLPLLGEVANWQATLILIGLPGVFLALLLFTVREPERRATAIAAPLSKSLWQHFREAPRIHASVHFVSAMTVFTGVTLTSWIATYFVRHFGMTPAEAGVKIGPVSAIGGMAGCIASGIVGDMLVARGIRGGRFCAGLLWWPVCLASLIGLIQASTASAALVWNFHFIFASAFGLASVVPTIQDITPAHLRGRATSIHFVMSGLLALGAGATMVALVTDRIFHDTQALGSSLLVVLVPVIVLSLATCVACQKGYEARRQQFLRCGTEDSPTVGETCLAPTPAHR